MSQMLLAIFKSFKNTFETTYVLLISIKNLKNQRKTIILTFQLILGYSGKNRFHVKVYFLKFRHSYRYNKIIPEILKLQSIHKMTNDSVEVILRDKYSVLSIDHKMKTIITSKTLLD